MNKIMPPRMGYLNNTPYGNIWVVDWEYQSRYMHGNFELEKSSGFNCLLNQTLHSFAPSNATVIDIETMGLAGGTGVYAFIIGAGFWKENKFIIRQYVLRDFNEEPAQLYAFADDLTESLISFNGKCYDIPLLQNRFRIHRFESPFENIPHLDMLFPSRRIWKRNLTSFKLTELEMRILGYARQDDVPSHRIPSIFFDYMQNRNEAILYPILNHNRDDIISLYFLTVYASSLIEKSIEFGGNDDDLLLSLIEICFNGRDYNKTIDMAEKINANFASKNTLLGALKLKALGHKKLGQWEKAIEAFKHMFDIKPEIYSSVELAKLYEHKLKDPEKALEVIDRVEAILQFDNFSEIDILHELQLLKHRKKRLRRKTSRMFQT